jgi:copper chaperone CopZ
MRQLLVVAILVLAVGTLRGEPAGGKAAEVKGPHICCGQCEKAVAAILAKVNGVSDAKCDRKAKTVTFTAKDREAADDAWQALYDGGFAGTLTFDGTTVAKKAAKPATKVNEVKIEKVHACCGMCHDAIKALFKDSTVTITGKGYQRTITIEGKDLDPSAVLNTLNETGFNGKIAAKK